MKYKLMKTKEKIEFVLFCVFLYGTPFFAGWYAWHIVNDWIKYHR